MQKNINSELWCDSETTVFHELNVIQMFFDRLCQLILIKNMLKWIKIG